MGGQYLPRWERCSHPLSLTDEKCEAQRSVATCPGSHSWWRSSSVVCPRLFLLYILSMPSAAPHSLCPPDWLWCCLSLCVLENVRHMGGVLGSPNVHCTLIICWASTGNSMRNKTKSKRTFNHFNGPFYSSYSLAGKTEDAQIHRNT